MDLGMGFTRYNLSHLIRMRFCVILVAGILKP
jgi:hypothetical protein